MHLSKITITLSAALVMSGCGKKKDGAGGTGSASTGSGVALTTGSATMPSAGSAANAGSAATTPTAAPGKGELTSAVWKKDKKAGPLPFDHQVWVDDGNGNAQVYLIMNCSQIAEPCGVVKFDIYNPRKMDEQCKGWSMVHFAFSPPQGQQKAGMGPLKITPGKYGSKSAPLSVFLEYTNSDGSIGAQSYQEEPFLEITQAGDSLAGSFDTKYQDMEYKGSFNAKKCTCDPNSGECK